MNLGSSLMQDMSPRICLGLGLGSLESIFLETYLAIEMSLSNV